MDRARRTRFPMSATCRLDCVAPFLTALATWREIIANYFIVRQRLT